MKPTSAAARAKKAPPRASAKKPLTVTRRSFLGAPTSEAHGLAKKTATSGRRNVSVHVKLHQGIVQFYLDTAMGRGPTHDVPVSLQVEATEAGLPESELTVLQHSLDVSSERLLPLVGLSKATFHRRKTTGANLTPLVSDRVVRFALLLSKAIKVLGSKDDANKWLNSPQLGLAGAVPLDYAKSEVGAREVENLLGRIEYGVYT